MASIDPRINGQGQITSWRVQARDAGGNQRGRSFKAESDAQAFSEKVEAVGWERAIRSTVDQLSDLRVEIQESTDEDWYWIMGRHPFRAVFRRDLSIALEWFSDPNALWGGPARYPCYPDVRPTPWTVEVQYDGSVVDALTLMLSENHLVPLAWQKYRKWRTDEWSYSVARVINDVASFGRISFEGFMAKHHVEVDAQGTS